MIPSEQAVADVVRWNNFYSVGDPRLDRQHQEIISVANRLYEAMSAEAGEEAVPTLLRRLAEYTQAHFRDEEEAMRRSGFPHLEEHKRLHERLTEETYDLQFRCLQSDKPQPVEVLLFVKKWWVGHIVGADKQYAPYVLADQPRDAEPADAPASEENAAMDPEVAELIDALIENERQIGCYYRVMEDFIPEHKATWQMLARQEETHAVALVDVRRAVENAPHRVAPGRFTAAAARMMIQDVEKMIERIRQGDVHPRYAVSFITDIEQSLLEHELGQALATDVSEIRATLKKIREETVSHRALLHGIVL